ncbi:DMT family transporter [Klenkia brasiliensis]|uniref:Probable blue pigment (Indigoidine) exporter n=1 Tax=Klenkia brasiliensis TaxID=333142 RepID=A0A1G7PGQ6_9ACTN|nr:DMT family transporter [Klenkia brasiliensis]SDF84690.1 probable blue pigment (indigoidine) exporter [Klenkia brasiliensis]
MEDVRRWSLVTAVAPVAWGSTYVVTHHVLPPDQPLTGAALRALPAGLLLLAVARRLPRGAWWWRSAVLGTLDVGLFFVLVYESAQLLPSAVASTVMAASPVALTLLAWALLGQHPAPAHLVGGVVGVVGVGLLLLGGAAGVDPVGVVCAVAAMVSSSVGFVLARRWSDGTAGAPGLVATTSWQLLAGGAGLAVAAWATDDGWPPVDVPTVLGFGYVTVVATALAFLCWFAGLAHLPTGTVGLVGLLNPLTGVALGCLAFGEVLGVRQWAGVALVLAGIGLGQHQRSVRARPWSTRSCTPARSAGRAG